MPKPRHTAVVYDDTHSGSMSQGSLDVSSKEKASIAAASTGKFYCPCCPGWFFTPQKRYLHLAMQHTVYLPQLGGKVQADYLAEDLYVIPLLKPPTIRGGARVFSGHREEKAYRTAVKNAGRVPNHEQRCALWDGGVVPGDNHVPQHMDLPSTNPHDLQLAEFWHRNQIKLLHTGKLIDNPELEKRPEYRQDHGKLNSYDRYNESKMCWGDRSAGGDWSEPDPNERRNWSYKSPFKPESTAADSEYYSANWVDRPHYSNWSYYPNEGKGGRSEANTRPTDDSTAEDPTPLWQTMCTTGTTAATGPPQVEESQKTNVSTTEKEVPQAKPMPRMNRVVATGIGSAIVPATDPSDDEDIEAEIEAARKASLRQFEQSLKPHVLRVSTILDTDSPTTVFTKAFADYETLSQVEIDEILIALQDRVSEDTLAQVVRVVEYETAQSREPLPQQDDLDTSRRSIDIPAENQQRVPVTPTSQLERVLDQGNLPEQQHLPVVQPVAQRNVPVILPETTAETRNVEEFATPQGGWVSIDVANVQRLRTTEQGTPPPPQIVDESVLTTPLQNTVPPGIRPDLASVFVNADQMIAAYEKRPRAYPTRPIHGPALAPSTVSLTTPYSFSEWNTEQYGSLPSDLAIQQGEMLQMMWNHTRNQAARVDSIEQILANQYQILRAGTNESLIPLLTDSCLTTTETLKMMSEDRDAFTSIPHANRDNAGTYRELHNKVQVMASMAFKIYEKQKSYQSEYDLLLEKCRKTEADLAQARRDLNIWVEQCRRQDMIVIGLQRTVSTNHTRLSALEQSVEVLRENATATDYRVDERFQGINEHTTLMNDIAGTHTASIRRLTEDTRQREEAMTYSSIGRDQELSNRLAGVEGRAHMLTEIVHNLLEVRADEQGIPRAQRPPYRPVAPLPESQHGVIVHGYTGTPHFSMYEPPASTIDTIYRDPAREYLDTP
eukprot:3968854-Amphidinium_carterae.2